MGKNRSSNMEKYYGFRFEIEKSIDPVHEDAVRLQAKKWFDAQGLSWKEYLIYFHSIVIIPEREHFGFTNGLSDRAEEININYIVNEKQVKNGSIKFLNYFFEGPNEENVIAQYSTSHMIGFNISSSFFDRNPQFMSYIITYIRRDIRPDHRKIKVSVSARPTMRYRSAVNAKNLIRSTKADLRYDRPIQLRLPEMPPKSIGSATSTDRIGAPAIVNNFHGPVGSVASQLEGGIEANSNVTFEDVVRDLRQISGALSSSDSPDEELLQSVEDAIVVSRQGPTPRFKSILASISHRVLSHAEKIGAKALEAYVKTQLFS